MLKKAVKAAEKNLERVINTGNKDAIKKAGNKLTKARTDLEGITFGDKHLSQLTEIETELLEKIAKLKKPSKK